MAQLLDGVELFPQTLINVRLAPGADWKANQSMQQTIAQVETELADQGRVLIRASGTEPLLRVMVEAAHQADVDHWSARLAAAAQRPRPLALVRYLAHHRAQISPFVRFVRGLTPARRAFTRFLVRFISAAPSCI